MLCRLVMGICILAMFAAEPIECRAQSGTVQRANVSPLQFVQRNDVGREIQIQPAQRELAQRLQAICDAQCQAQIMEMFTSVSSSLQAQFLALDPEQRDRTVQTLDRSVRESIEMRMLDEAVLNSGQMNRLEQLRMQFMGLDSLLTDRARSLMGITNEQAEQLGAVQNIGSQLSSVCNAVSSDPAQGITISQMQQGIANIQNVVIDQSINILEGAQIDIFINLCGEPYEFDPPVADDPSVVADGDGVGDADQQPPAQQSAIMPNGQSGSNGSTGIGMVSEQNASSNQRSPTRANNSVPNQANPANQDEEGSGRR